MIKNLVLATYKNLKRIQQAKKIGLRKLITHPP